MPACRLLIVPCLEVDEALMHGLASSRGIAVMLEPCLKDRMLAQGLAVLSCESAAVVPGMVHALWGSPVYY